MIDIPDVGIKKRWAALIIAIFIIAFLAYNINVIANCDGDVVRGMTSFICLEEGG